ncbi:MAG TPA: GerAB/ArcD/ProY family transporter [Ureibacillus sp.]|nr:GerAB/ArcD/ProY family transporter [Ureibacillus sp.]
MSRFYYYLILINMIANIIASVPVILIQYRKNGVILSMILGIIVGLIIVYLITNFFNSYPGKSLPDLLKATMPKWFNIFFTFVLIGVWFFAGLITLITFTILLIHFLAPEMTHLMGTLLIVFFMAFGCFMKADKVLYTVEIIFVLTLPMLLFIFFKAYTNEQMEWDYVKVAITYINTMPRFLPFMSSVFLFLGVLNLVIFNQFFTTKQSIGWKQITFIGILGTVVLFTTYFIPIGFNGFENIESIMYPWVSTSDSMRIRYGFIERVVFVFLLFYLAISCISLLIHWHVVVELLKSIFNFNKLKIKNVKITPFIVIIAFITITAITVILIDELQIYYFTTYYYLHFAISVPSLLIVMWMIKRRLKNAKKT